ncbi:carbohydrate porin [Saccharicrinis aurantiacus]|uniref:carbohydrate porin n=1 Tax=Saccharicrinis aurantiacus TaxID=1849719 RepID=UPI00094F52D1|nr:carbohydrate porin [Saccharicrinis aurantiacus]
MKYKYAIILVLILILDVSIGTSQAQNEGTVVLTDSTESNYQNNDAMGGPKTVGAQLQADNQKKDFYFRVPVRVMQPWYEMKQKVNEKFGIQFGVNYTSVFMHSTATISDVNRNNTSSGILDLQAGWNLVNRKTGKNKGTLFLKINSRHAYGDFTNPMFHGIFESGYYGLPATGFNNYSIRALELNWQQNLINDKLTIVLGKVDVTNYFNFHGLIVPWQHYLGYGSSVSGTVNWPNQGVGIVAGYKITDNIYAMGALTDAYGDRFNDGEFLHFGDQFFKGNFFKALEVGYVPSMAERYFKKISVTYWDTDAYTNPAGGEVAFAQGLAISSHWFFAERFIPHLRFGFSNGNGENAFYKKDLQIGHGLRFKSHDILGTSFSWAETNIPGSKDQMTVEVFYRFNLTAHLEITPDYQFIINPTFNPDSNTLSYFGIRGRITM